MSVYIPCDKCRKRLKIPETVVGRSIKCPTCGAVFKADPAKVLSAKPSAPPAEVPEPAAVAPAAHEDDEDVLPMRKRAAVDDDDEDLPAPPKKAAALDDDEEAPPPKKKAVIEEDEDEVRPAKKKAAAIEDDDDEDDRPARSKKKAAASEDDDDEDDRPARSKKRRPADEDEEEDEDEDKAKKPKRRTPWYVMLPLMILSFSGVGLALLWVYGFAYVGMDKTLQIDFDKAVIIGVSTAGAVTLICLILSLLGIRAWLRFLLVFLFLLLGYGGSLGVMYWSYTEQPGMKKKATAPAPLVVACLDRSRQATVG